jgi:NAD(P)H-hydrate epimerase
VWAVGGSEILIGGKGSATACAGVESAVLPKPGLLLWLRRFGRRVAGIMASMLAQTVVDTLTCRCLLDACEVHGLAGSMRLRSMDRAGVMAHDVIDAVGVAMDTLIGAHLLPEMALQG